MNQFYFSLLSLGIILVIIAFIWIAYDWKKSGEEHKLLEDKKGELAKIITEAEQMIDELNKFSGYVVTQMEQKSDELSSRIKDIDDRMNKIQENTEKKFAGDDNGKSKNVSVIDVDGHMETDIMCNNNYAGNAAGTAAGAVLALQECSVCQAENSSNKEQIYIEAKDTEQDETAPVFPIIAMQPSGYNTKGEKPLLNLKHKAVIQMYKKGIEGTEIARKLNIGKGEIELILGIYK